MVKTGILHLEVIDLQKGGLDGLFLSPNEIEGTFLETDIDEENYFQLSKNRRNESYEKRDLK